MDLLNGWWKFAFVLPNTAIIIIKLNKKKQNTIKYEVYTDKIRYIININY